MMKTNACSHILRLMVISVFMGMAGCKKDVRSSENLDGNNPKTKAEARADISATFPVKYYKTVKSLIQQGKDYTSFQNIPGWKIVNTPTTLNGSNKLNRIADEGDDAEEFTEFDQYDNYSAYGGGVAQEDEEFPYFSGLDPVAENNLFGDGTLFPVITGEQHMIYNGSWEPLPKRMKIIHENLQFPKRNVTMYIRLPFYFIRTYYSNNGLFRFCFTDVTNDKGDFHVSGPKMGDLSESDMHFYWHVTRNGYGEFAGSGITEKRTVIYSETGSMKISANIDLGRFKIGAEYGTGFTISSASHTYTYYDVQGSVYFDEYTYSWAPTFQSIWMPYSNGIQKD